MSKVFVSYRRDDSAAYAGRLYDRLSSRFGRGTIFMDIDHIEPGEDFVEVINAAIGASSVLIVLIGRQWASLMDHAGLRRLENPEDFVRLEVSAALEKGVRTIPVLVAGASMPPAQDLPQPLQPLARRHAVDLSDLRFHSDVDRLIDTIEKILASVAEDSETVDSKTEATPPASNIGKTRTGSQSSWPVKRWIGRALVLAVTGFIASLGMAWMRGTIHGMSYIDSAQFWEVDVWLLWFSFTIVFGVLFGAFRSLRDKIGKRFILRRLMSFRFRAKTAGDSRG